MSIFSPVRNLALWAVLVKYRVKVYRVLAAVAFMVITVWLYPDVATYLGQQPVEREASVGWVLLGKTLLVYAAFVFAIWQFRPEPAAAQVAARVNRRRQFVRQYAGRFFRLALALVLAGLTHWQYPSVADYLKDEQAVLGWALAGKTAFIYGAVIYACWQLRPDGPGKWSARGGWPWLRRGEAKHEAKREARGGAGGGTNAGVGGVGGTDDAGGGRAGVETASIGGAGAGVGRAGGSSVVRRASARGVARMMGTTARVVRGRTKVGAGHAGGSSVAGGVGVSTVGSASTGVASGLSAPGGPLLGSSPPAEAGTVLPPVLGRDALSHHSAAGHDTAAASGAAVARQTAAGQSVLTSPVPPLDYKAQIPPSAEATGPGRFARVRNSLHGLTASTLPRVQVTTRNWAVTTTDAVLGAGRQLARVFKRSERTL